MRIFIAPEVGELLGLRRIIFLQGIGKIVVDPRVLLLLGNGQREDFFFVEAIK